MSNTVIVYKPDGSSELHTRANARDLVNGSGYSWLPGIRTSPNQFAPFATAHAPDGPPPSQRVLDSVGNKAAAADTANQAMAAQQAQMAQALAQQQAQQAAAMAEAAAAAAAPVIAAAPAAAPVDFSKVEVDSSDLDDEAAAEAIIAEEPKADRGAARRARKRG